MAIDNLIHIEFSEDETNQLNHHIAEINKILEGKVVNLIPDERKQYGRIADKNKILVDKCKSYMDNNPETLPRTLDKEEFDADYKARTQIETPLRAIDRIREKLSDTKILLDHDNFNAAITYYRYVKYLALENEPGTTSIYQDLRKHYHSTGNKSQKEAEGTTEEPSTPTE